jgi:hypothetical protein
MRLGTWNLAGRCTSAHRELLSALDCDVLLLTEVDERLVLPGFFGHLTVGVVTAGRSWSGIFSRGDLVGLDDPHPASAMARVGDVTFCSSVLPWRASGNALPWGRRLQPLTPWR